MSEADQRPSLRQVFGSVGRGLRQSAAPLVTYGVLAKVLEAGLLGPLAAWVLGLLISMTGSVAISNEQILSFAFSPLGAMTLLVTGTLAFLATFLEQSGLLIIGHAAYAGSRCGALAALWHAIRRGRDLLVLALLQLLLLAACFLPFGVIAGITYAAWLSDHDINYYLAQKPPAFWAAAAVGGVSLAGLLLTLGWLYVRLLFALPACVLAGQRPTESLRLSFQLTKGRVLRYAGILLAWIAVVAVLGAVLTGALQIVERLAIGLAGERLGLLVPALAGLVVLNVLVAAVVSLLGVTTGALLVVRLYGDAAMDRPELRAPLPAGRPTGGGLPRWLSRRRLVFGAVLLFLAATAAVSHLLIAQIGIEDRVAVTAHRGSSLRAPENSLSAVEAAVREGADFAEIDVQETADGVVVVLHDSDLMRVAGLNKNIWEVEYAEIESLDAGSWFSPEFQGERIPTLQQMIDTARGRIRLNIELKFNGHDKRLVERVVGLVRENDFHDQCVLSSLDLDGVGRAKALDGRVRVGHIVAAAVGDVARLDVDFLSVQQNQATPSLVRSLHRAGKEIHVWTVNDRQRMSAFVDLGVDNLLTDDPRLLRAVLDERAEMSNARRLLLGVRQWLAP
jgi:glycerophosphoryl diester phosphodiesterase